ncbi:hypothetical protein L6164_000898 [Bauhinia variegata]|uniref:Uncharacterized protein n=1 Tax=Bauhinia variegata TaxID=167791 RepID=A0ACB9Q7W8_BAUVA|nr:hypothetical protein L6164_000898 [Bauhinia variegata]
MSKLGEYSRLWNHEDIVDVLTTNSGSDSIQGIMFDPPEQENLRNSRIISLNSLQNFEKLTCIDLSNCQLLIQIPDLSGTPNITSLRLEGCTSLKEVHDSVGVQTKLEILKLDGCTNLEIFPRGIKMTSLYILSLQGCRSLRHFPNILEEMVNLWYINVQGSGIKEIPHSICYLPELVVLNVSHCYDLVSLPESINQLDRLGSLNVCYCKKLCQFPRAPPNLQELRVDGCGSLTSQSLNSIFSQALQAVKPFEVHMSRIHIPNWFEHRCKGGRLSFWASEKDVRKFTFAAVLKKLTSKISSQWNESGHIQILHYNNGIPTSNCGVHDFSNESGTILLQFVDYSNINIHDWNHVEIECRSIEYSSMSPDYEIDECGVYICKEDINMEDIRFECPIPSNSNMDTVMSKNDEEPRDMIEEAKPRKRSRRFMSSNDEKVDEEKPRKMGRRVGSSNGKQREASELARRRFIKKRIGSQEQEWSIPSLLCCSALLGLLLLGIMLMEKKVKEDA